jgi:hypothetical protein
VAQTQTNFNAVRFYVLSKERGLVWFYVWDDPKSETAVRWYAVYPPRSAKALSTLEQYVRLLCEGDLAGRAI